MKKIVIIAIVFSLAIGAAVAFAAQTDVSNYTFNAPTGGTINLTFKASQNVSVAANAAAQQYSAGSKHLNGDKIYGISSALVTIFFTTSSASSNMANNLTALTTAIGSVTDSSKVSTWTSM